MDVTPDLAIDSSDDPAVGLPVGSGRISDSDTDSRIELCEAESMDVGIGCLDRLAPRPDGS